MRKYELEANELLRIENGDFLHLEDIPFQDKEKLKLILNNKINENEKELNGIVVSNTETIMTLLYNTKSLKEELFKSKKTVDYLESQVSIISKKLIEPYNKIIEIKDSKQNTDKTIDLIERIRSFKSEIKFFRKLHEDNPNLLESSTSLHSYMKIRGLIKQSENEFKYIDQIRPDIEFFYKVQNNIVAQSRLKFSDVINKKVSYNLNEG